MRSGVVLASLMAALVAALGLPATASAATLLSQNFEPPIPLSSTSAGPAGFVQVSSGTAGWEVQGGGGAGGISLTAGIGANGVGGSQALFANWDHTPAAPGFFTFNQYTTYGSVAPAGVPASAVKVELDLFMSGSETANNPMNVLIQNGGNDLVFKPTLSNGAYTHVSYLLNQATNAGLFNPGVSSNLRLEHGAGGFGFDANNIVRVDNILIQTIPEPGTLALIGIGTLGVAGFRRRRG